MKLNLPNLIKDRRPTGKNTALFGALAIMLATPELLVHKAALILHLAYETASFLLEEVLMHGLGFNKHHAQMLVFYALICLSIWVLRLLWRRLPKMLAAARSKLLLTGLRIKYHVLDTWLALSLWQKFQWVTVQLFGLSVGFMLLLA